MEEPVNDTYKPVPWSQHDLKQDPCGVTAGSRLRLKKDLVEKDEGGPTGKVYPAGELWTAIEGLSSEPEVVWLLQPDGEMHTWTDDKLLSWFEIVDDVQP